jgi:beta-alanine--pyruvate transaminase
LKFALLLDDECQALRDSNFRHSELMPQEITDQQLLAHWMPFSGNREFRADPRLTHTVDDKYYVVDDGRKIFDGLSGLWTCVLSHNMLEIREAVHEQLGQLISVRVFSFGQPKSFQ